MSIQKFNPNDDFEFFTIETNPRRTYSSSSMNGITGSVFLFAQRSNVEKEVYPLSMFSSSLYTDKNIELLRNTILAYTGSFDKESALETYMRDSHEQTVSFKKQLTLDINRYQPSADVDRAFLIKNEIRKHLYSYYRVTNPKLHHFITNYNCLNFFTASNVPSDSVLMYPNSGSEYCLDNKFTFDFFIKPKYTTEGFSQAYKAGSIVHLTSSYCVSLHSGSSKDPNGKPNKFRIALAISSSADRSPGLMNPAETDSLTFWTEDNALDINEWNHVVFTWGGPNYNYGSGSIYVNRQLNSQFVHTSSLNLGNVTDPKVLMVGNYYEGQNRNTNGLSRFFATDTVTREGLLELDGNSDVFAPDNFQFNHPLNAELHDIKIYERYLTNLDVLTSSREGPSSNNGLLRDLKFFVPPFFTEESPYQQYFNGNGGEFVTPFYTQAGSPNTPFAGRMAFGVGGHYINLENYGRDFATGRYPRLWNLTGSVIEAPLGSELTANTILYATGSIRKRLYTVLPCDDGNYYPNFTLLNTLSGSKFVNDFGNSDLGHVTLNDIVPGNIDARSIVITGSILDDVLGVTPEDITGIPSDNLAILNRTRDNSSSQIVIFNISNMFYGMNIKPQSFMVRDLGISGSDNKLGITLRDDGIGNLYRADVSGSHATWAPVGNIFYNEGLVILKYPQLYFFGANQFEMEFQGVQNIHTFTMNCMAEAMNHTSSSNPSYLPLSASTDLANETDQKFVWITSVLIHDENMNVISKTNLAQPLVKRSGDKILFRIKTDW